MKEYDRPKHLTSSIAKHGALLVAGYILGSLNDVPLVGVLLASLIALAWHLFHINKLREWLSVKKIGPIPYGSGPWPFIFARTQHFRERNLYNKQRAQDLEAVNLEFIDSLPNAAFVLNTAFEVVSCNSQASELVDSSEDLIGRPITNYLRQPYFVRFLERKKYDEPVMLSSPRNPEQALKCSLTRYGEDGWLLQLTDISVQIKALQIREDFVANASHELRTPVTVVKGYLDAFIDDSNVPQDMQPPLKSMLEQVDRMQAIVADLLTLNVLESSGPAETDTRVDIPKIIRAVEQQAQDSTIRPVNFSIALDCAKGILGNKSDLHSIVSNLVSNAFRFTPEDGSVSVTWEPASPGARLIVEDSGIGINEEELERITERFYRTDSGRARHQFGTGLGLAIVKHAAAKHDAELLIESETGVGSRFTVVFPEHRLTALDE